MAHINSNYLNIKESYLFSEVAARANKFKAENPDKDVIKVSIGDVTRPLAPAVVEAMVKASREMGDAATFRGYCEETCGAYDFLRFTIRD